MIHIRSLTRIYNRDVDYEETEHYEWSENVGSGSGSGTGSGTTAPGWRLTMITESGSGFGERTLEYSYSGSGSSWGEWGSSEQGSEYSSQWQAQRSISQQSTSTQTLGTTTSYTGGEGSTTGADTRTVSADGTASTAYSGESSDRWWSDGYTHTSDDTTQNTTQDDYDYQYDWSETYNGDGTTSTSETASNTASGSVAGSSTHDWSWSYEGSCSSGSGSGSGSGSSSGGGSGCGSNSGSSGTSSSNWSDSYDETVSYPGFYSGAYYTSYGYGSGGGYAGDEPLDYLGDDFSSSSGSGSGGGGYLPSQEDPESAPQQVIVWTLPHTDDGTAGLLQQQQAAAEALRQRHEALWEEANEALHWNTPQRIYHLFADNDEAKTFFYEVLLQIATEAHAARQWWEHVPGFGVIPEHEHGQGMSGPCGWFYHRFMNLLDNYYEREGIDDPDGFQKRIGVQVDQVFWTTGMRFSPHHTAVRVRITDLTTGETIGVFYFDAGRAWAKWLGNLGSGAGNVFWPWEIPEDYTPGLR